MQLDLAGALNVGMISIIFAFLFVDLFDTSGTLIGAAQRGGLLDKDGKLPPRLGRALMSDSVATMSGAAWVPQPPPAISNQPLAFPPVVAQD